MPRFGNRIWLRRIGNGAAALLYFYLVGWLAGKRIGQRVDLLLGLSDEVWVRALGILWAVLALVFALFAQLILHEAGHLVCGLATGYKFCSFRIGGLMWQKEEDGIRRYRYSLAGTGGQCLLAPPDLVDGKMPCVLYNLGGPLANLFTAALFCFLGGRCDAAVEAALEPTPQRVFVTMTWLGLMWALAVLFDLLALWGLGMGLSNGVPLSLSCFDNDGRNALSLKKHPAAMRAFWVQLKVNEQQAHGVRLKEMPAEWFALPEESGWNNALTAALALLRENRQMDEHDFAAAAQLARLLDEKAAGLLGLHRSLLLCDRLYCALLRGEDAAPLLARWNEKGMKKFRRQMEDFPSVQRTEYAAALLAEGDTANANVIRARFEARAKNYPYAAEIETERELMCLAEQAGRKEQIQT